LNKQRGDCGVCVLVMRVMMGGALLMWGHGGHRGMGQGHHVESREAPEAARGVDAGPGTETAPPVPVAAHPF
jgi:hypothetical protein